MGIGALRTSQMLAHADEAFQSGASALLLALMSYQALTENDVSELFRAVTDHTDLPVMVYDNLGTTHFSFTNDLNARIARSPGHRVHQNSRIARQQRRGAEKGPKDSKRHPRERDRWHLG